MNSRGVYIRVGSTKRVASYDEMTRMVKMRYAHEYETRLCNRDDLTFDYLKKRLNEKGIEFDKNALSLVDKDGNYNNVALLFSDQNDTISKFAVFQGTDVEVFLDKKEFRGSLVEQLDNILYFASLSNRKKIVITGKPDHEEYLDIPKMALREAIVNCYCHRDWTLSGDIKIEAMPTLMIMEKEEGELRVTEEVIIGEKKITKNNEDYVEPIFSEAGIVFKILPEIKNVNGEKKIILKMDTEISNFKLTSSYNESSGAKQKNQTRTTITLNNGGSTFIGGLKQNVGKETVRKIPILSSIPIIGPLFKYQRKNKEMRDIYIEIEAIIQEIK